MSSDLKKLSIMTPEHEMEESCNCEDISGGPPPCHEEPCECFEDESGPHEVCHMEGCNSFVRVFPCDQCGGHKAGECPENQEER